MDIWANCVFWNVAICLTFAVFLDLCTDIWCVWERCISALQAQKEILDTELDIIAKQNEGADTSVLRMRVAELKREVSAVLFVILQKII